MVTPKVTPDGYVKTGVAARRLEASDHTVRGLFDRGELDGVRSPGGYRLIALASLEQYQRYLTVTQAAHRLEVSSKEVRRRFDAGELEGYRTQTGARRIRPDMPVGECRQPEGDDVPLRPLSP